MPVIWADDPEGSTTFCGVSFDLAATFAAGGTHEVLRLLVVEWFGVKDLAPSTSTVELLDLLRSTEVLLRIPQSQDRLLAAPEIERTGGAVVIAEENQVLWYAVFNRQDDPPIVTFFDEPPEGRSPGIDLHRLGALDLDRFLLGLLVENAVQSAPSSCFRCQIEPRTEVGSVLASAVQLVVGKIKYPAVVAGPGWFGMRGKNSLIIAAADPELRVSTVLGTPTWERFAEITPLPTAQPASPQRSPWGPDPTVPHRRWMPVEE